MSQLFAVNIVHMCLVVLDSLGLHGIPGIVPEVSFSCRLVYSGQYTHLLVFPKHCCCEVATNSAHRISLIHFDGLGTTFWGHYFSVMPNNATAVSCLREYVLKMSGNVK